jgi:ketosteroid isomerase-like protein
LYRLVNGTVSLPASGALSSLAREKEMSPAEKEVRKASEQFYAALNLMANGNPGALADIWSKGDDATTMHPIGGREVGWDRVQEAFRQVARIASDGRIRVEEQIVQVVGDLAYELGVERGSLKLVGKQAAIEHRVTNIYRREGGKWKIVHHHTDISPAMVEITSELLARS